MAIVKSDMLKEGGMYTFSALPDQKFVKVPGSDIYVNNNGDSIVYNAKTKSFTRRSSKVSDYLFLSNYDDPNTKEKENEIYINGKTEYTTSSDYENNVKYQNMDDNSISNKIVESMNKVSGTKNKRKFGITNKDLTGKGKDIKNSSSVKALYHQNNIVRSNELDLYNKTYRFGYFNPVAISNTREFLFFTKPDLHILDDSRAIAKENNTEVENYPRKVQNPDNAKLSGPLNKIPFWKMLAANSSKTIKLLQSSLSKDGDKFNHLLQNQCISNLEVPSLSSEMIDTATNTYGVGFSYRGSSEASDDKPSFSLEFKETKYLDIYYYFKAYEEYETLKHHGVISPFKEYIEDRVLHDQISIYKFIVDEDMETILYYGKMYGVVPKSLPRDVFGTTSFDNGLSYSVDFEAAFYEDMNPHIIADFNALSKDFYNKRKYRVDVYNDVLDSIDNRATNAAYIEIIPRSKLKAKSQFAAKSTAGYIFKLRWRGDDKV